MVLGQGRRQVREGPCPPPSPSGKFPISSGSLDIYDKIYNSRSPDDWHDFPLNWGRFFNAKPFFFFLIFLNKSSRFSNFLQYKPKFFGRFGGKFLYFTSFRQSVTFVGLRIVPPGSIGELGPCRAHPGATTVVSRPSILKEMRGLMLHCYIL